MRAGIYWHLFLNFWKSNFQKNKLHIFIFLLIICSVFLFFCFFYWKHVLSCASARTTNQKHIWIRPNTSCELMFTGLLLFPWDCFFLWQICQEESWKTQKRQKKGHRASVQPQAQISVFSPLWIYLKNNQVNTQLLKSCRSSLQTEDFRQLSLFCCCWATHVLNTLMFPLLFSKWSILSILSLSK